MKFLAGLWPLWLLLVVVLTFWLRTQYRQRKALRDWLKQPVREDIPDGVGAWREIFSALQRLRKEEEARQTALGNTLERFRRAVLALPDGVILLDAENHIEWLNEAATQHFSLDIRRDIGIPVGHLIRYNEIHTLLSGGQTAQPLILNVNGYHGGSKERVFSVQLIPFSDTGKLLLSQDVTSLARTEAMRRDFVANVSHELRTPLTVIGGFLEQFRSDAPPDGEAAQHFFKLMAEQSERMNRLVTDLLTLSRLENETRAPVDERVEMAELLETLQAEAVALSDGRHQIRCGEVSAGDIKGSTHELRSAFGNLVTNAVRYTPTGGKVTLDWRLIDGCPVFSVTDSGIGIPPEHIPRLTERFYRVDKGRSSATGGTGLGLAIVKHVLVRHQGTLQITSEMGRGSTFSVRLPASRLA